MSTANPPSSTEGAVVRASRHQTRRAVLGWSVVRFLFVVTLVLFLIGGFVVVAAQAVEIVAGDGTAVTSIGEKLGPPTFVVSAICGLLAFVMEYLRTGEAEEGSD
jgi:hypothetical protein